MLRTLLVRSTGIYLRAIFIYPESDLFDIYLWSIVRTRIYSVYFYGKYYWRLKIPYLNLGRDEGWAPVAEQTESALLEVLGDVISPAEHFRPCSTQSDDKLRPSFYAVVLDSAGFLWKGTNTTSHIPSGSNQTYNWSCTWDYISYIYALSRYKI